PFLLFFVRSNHSSITRPLFSVLISIATSDPSVANSHSNLQHAFLHCCHCPRGHCCLRSVCHHHRRSHQLRSVERDLLRRAHCVLDRLWCSQRNWLCSHPHPLVRQRCPCQRVQDRCCCSRCRRCPCPVRDFLALTLAAPRDPTTISVL
ncbi:hypothetical protein OIDMADRAFT_177724, partial [Oidiodendron maius Zn]